MAVSIGLYHVIDTTGIFYRIWSIIHDHIRCLTRGMDMHISESKKSLKYSCGIGVHFLDSVEATLGYTARKCRYLLDADDTRISDDKEVKLIIDPIEEDKGEKPYPVNSNPRPINSFKSDELNNRSLIGDEYPCCDDKCYEVEKVIY
jgi:hypothetical protein